MHCECGGKNINGFNIISYLTPLPAHSNDVVSSSLLTSQSPLSGAISGRGTITMQPQYYQPAGNVPFQQQTAFSVPVASGGQQDQHVVEMVNEFDQGMQQMQSVPVDIPSQDNGMSSSNPVMSDNHSIAREYT